MGIMRVREVAEPVYHATSGYFDSSLSYYSISLALNLLLTLMIIGRLALYRRNIENLMGASDEFNKLYSSITTMIVESYAPYTIVSLLNLGLFVADSPYQYVFLPVLGYSQVCTPGILSPSGALTVMSRRPLPRSS
jgi:hypothetical protein